MVFIHLFLLCVSVVCVAREPKITRRWLEKEKKIVQTRDAVDMSKAMTLAFELIPMWVSCLLSCAAELREDRVGLMHKHADPLPLAYWNSAFQATKCCITGAGPVVG